MDEISSVTLVLLELLNVVGLSYLVTHRVVVYNEN